ncbi:MAG TPA: hypothetical protein P5267_01095 [Patescibacteria group bacterium]|nr:hypothetical protein [Patescibacteria group bacterium]
MTSLREQLKNLNIEPGAEWKKETRNFLMSEVKKQRTVTGNQESGWLENFVNFFKISRLAWRPVGVVALMAVFVLGGSGFVAVASRNAVPGDKLFAVKRAMEKVNYFMVTDTAHKTELASAVLGTRVNDLQKVLDQETKLIAADSQEQTNEESIMVAVKEVSKQIDEVNEKFTAMQSEDKESGQKVAATALDLNEKIRSYKEELKTVKEKVSDSEANKELDKVLDRVEDINSEVLAVLVDKHSKGEAPIEATDLAMRVGEHVRQVETKIETVTDTVKTQETEVKNSELVAKMSEATETIKKANEALDKNEYLLALTLAKDSDKILEMIFGSIYEVKNDEGQVKGAESEATSTVDIVKPVVDNETSTTTTKNLEPAESGQIEPEPEEEPAEFQVNILQ